MKFLVALLIAIPTLIAVLLFAIARVAYSNPAMLAASTNPVIAMLCIIAGIISAIPLFVAVVIGLGSLFGTNKEKEKKNK